MHGSCCNGSGNGSMMACCKGCGTPMGKGHFVACSMWFLSKLLLVAGLVGFAMSFYLNYYDELWYWYDSIHMYFLTTNLFLLSIITRLCYSGRKKADMMGMMMKSEMDSGCCDEKGNCGSC